MASNKSMTDCCEDTATTTFADEGVTLKSEFSTSKPGDVVHPEMYTICDFLSKPVLLASGAWSTGDFSNTVLTSIDPADYVTNGVLVVEPWYSKLKGFNLMRGTFVVRVVLNAMPFHQGALLLHYLPNEAAVAASGYTGFEDVHNVNLTTKTQQPCMEMIAGASAAVFDIPYISPTSWYTIPTDGGSSSKVSWGTFYLTVLSALQTGVGQVGNADYTIYGYWKEVELAAPLIPHSSKGMRRSTKIKALPPRLSVPSEEAENTDKTVSKALSNVSIAAGVLSAIPGLGPLMGSLSWASGIASGVASAFGYSKPISTVAPMVMANQLQRYNATSDGIDTSIPLGLIHDNQTAITDRYTVYDGDEMSFAFLKSVSAYITAVSWTTGAFTNQSIFNKTMTPSSIKLGGTKTVGLKTMTYETGPPIFYLAKAFSLWRGSFKIRLKIVKTMYHTGRLQVTWTPSSFYTTVPGVNTTAMYCMREIIDIRDTDEITLMLPFLTEFEYISTGNNTVDTFVNSGTFNITVLNELRAPDTVADNVQILVYVAGGDDFELSAPIWEPELAYRLNGFSPQMETGQIDSDHKISKVIGTNAPIPVELQTSLKCSGEQFTSVKQLINRMTSMNLDVLKLTGSNSAVFDPWFVDIIKLTPVTGAISKPSQGGDIFSYIAKMYLYFRGSARLHYQLSSQNLAITATLTKATPTNFVDTTPRTYLSLASSSCVDTVNSRSSGSGIATLNDNDGFGTISVPYHCKTPVSFVLAKSDATTSTTYLSQPIAYPQVQPTVSSGTNNGGLMYRSMKDDFQFSFFIGCPPVVLNYT